MRRGIWLLALGVVAAALGVTSARADTGTTTTDATSTTTTASYSALPPSPLPPGCLGAGAGAIVLPAHVLALGTPASDLGPSVYARSAGAILAFAASSANGWTCRSAELTLTSLSLFNGAVTASSVQARAGKGIVTGLEIDGSAVSAAAGQTVPVESWGQLTLGGTVGRVTAPLVLRLLQAHDSLPAGTAIAVAFAVAALPVAKPAHHQQAPKAQKHGTDASHAQKHAGKAQHATTKQRQSRTRPPDFPATHDPFRDGSVAPAAEHNAVVSLAMRYLGVPYTWAGASPKTGFDCSGLVEYVFARLGISLPHYAAAQWYSPDAVSVPSNRLQPGDLVFFTGADGTRKEPGHVGIYIGDGYLIDAPHTGAFVQVDSLNERWFANKYVGAKRIVGAALGARHLLGAKKRQASAPVDPLAALPLLATQPVAETVGVDSGGKRAGSRVYWIWGGAALGGLLLLLSAGGLEARRRHRSVAAGSTMQGGPVNEL